MKCFLLIFLFSSISYCNALKCKQENLFGITTYVTCPRPNDSPNARYCCGDRNDMVICCDNPYGIDQEDFERLASNRLPKRNLKKRANQNAIQNTTQNDILVDKKTVTPNEGFRDDVLNKAKDKGKQKIKDIITKKVEKSIDPSGTMKLPAILGTIVAVIISIIVLCIVCCCCCPFCLLYKKRSRGAIHNPAPTATQMPPQQNYAPVQSYPNQPYPPQQQPVYPPQQQGYQMTSQPGYGPPASNAPYPISQPPYPTTPYTTASNVEQPPPYAEKQLPYNPNY